MRIAACLVWFDESVASLERCVASLAGVVDVVVACDGRWRMFPGEDLYSPPDQAVAIARAASAAGLELDVRQAPPWALESQVTKRDYAMRIAGELADFVLVIDGDEWVESCDADLLRELLVGESDVCEVAIRNAGRGVFQTRPHPRRRIYRSGAGVSVESAHNGYRSDDGRWLNGDRDHVELATASDASPALALVNDRDARSADRQQRSGFYYRVRSLLREEAVA